MIISNSTIPESFSKTPEVREPHPGWASIKLWKSAIEHASVMCFMYQKEASNPFARCPLMFFHILVKNLEQRHSTALLVGFKAEFNQPCAPLDRVAGDATMAGLQGMTLQFMYEHRPVCNVHAIGCSRCTMLTLHDGYAKSFDTILPKDTCATDSPRYTQESAGQNCCRNWDFLTSWRALGEAAISL